MKIDTEFVLIIITVLVIVTLVLWTIWLDHKERMEALRQRQAEKDLCLCKHERWYHMADKRVSPHIRCFEFAEPQTSLQLCNCPGFKMDNLLYLEKKLEERR